MASQSSPLPAQHQTDSQIFCDWIQSRIDDGTLKSGEAMVLGGDMLAEVELLVRNGYQVTLVDPTGKDLAAAKKKNISLKWAAQMPFTEIKPWHIGNLDLILDRTTLESLAPEMRFAYANRMGRFLPNGSHLAGVFRLGLGTETQVPYSLTPDAFRRLMGRYFVSERLEAFPGENLSASTKYLGMLQRRSAPRKPQRPR